MGLACGLILLCHICSQLGCLLCNLVSKLLCLLLLLLCRHSCLPHGNVVLMRRSGLGFEATPVASLVESAESPGPSEMEGGGGREWGGGGVRKWGWKGEESGVLAADMASGAPACSTIDKSGREPKAGSTSMNTRTIHTHLLLLDQFPLICNPWNDHASHDSEEDGRSSTEEDVAAKDFRRKQDSIKEFPGLQNSLRAVNGSVTHVDGYCRMADKTGVETVLEQLSWIEDKLGNVAMQRL
ncbi:hypothetical protein BDK51DRAFT_26060 [Blyttiomyces helicus]|uniref:Uncharacterized protein n=1 Tax=Blyttiomyces helicus TaxID=388810 RepID=A0A4P9VXD5_9FUNG|nr:hypothetical protein BDK51DRAFT_26060 [Blyttiomyces helicus]|eukprot:RKO83565.1 hypothetical protein BDK51DRAFT_26060 [Blyttiomyces helicus]